ncbi:MAG: polyribonucleotide nucleotidyltransferase, partial [bacterium]|nr:polyribonucleotide nucleotidyltransferase [bacterium]
MKSKTYKIELGGRELIIEINDLAEQANGSVFVRYGDTMVLATAVMSKEDKGDMGFFPLTVEYEERYYAAGKIKGARYIRREGKPSDEAICNARLIDRSIRPLFPENLKREVQVVITVLSFDGQNEPDILGLIAASLALSISDIPWSGPLAALRGGGNEEQLILNPTYEEREKSKIDVVFSAVEKEELIINMIEGRFEQAGEPLVLKSWQSLKPSLQKLIDLEKEIAKEIGKKKAILPVPESDPELEKKLKEFLGKRLEEAVFQKRKEESSNSQELLKGELISLIKESQPEKIGYALNFLEKEIDKVVHENAIKKGLRPDGRKLDELRELRAQVGLLPRTHGSGVFGRGETKALSILTLGAPGDVQLLEGMEIVGKKRFMHHYNFPPYSVGEVKPMRGPGRREIGHGMLVEKAILPLIPSIDDFPYTIRVVSEIVSSNGSTSMASVCASCLALMDAGVPISAPVAGISIGLMSESRIKDISPVKADYRILTDIQGHEDHHGDMDFKVAGTGAGITAIQMDVKIPGITEKIFQEALDQAKTARLKILEAMAKTIEKPRPELSPFAPRIIVLQINPEKIREVIGPGGKVINEIIDQCGVSIDIEDTGEIFITAEKEEAAKKAVEWIKNITHEVKIGEIFQGKVKRIMAFGAFVEILPGQEGLVHISQLADYRVNK